MRIDNENKVVWCNIIELKWYNSFGDRAPIKLTDRIRRLSDWGWGVGLLDSHGKDVRDYDEWDEYIVVFNDNNTRLMLNLTKSLCDDYEFKLEQPQKYHWRKKKEHLTWFEDFEQVLIMSKNNSVLRFGNISSYDNRYFQGKFTEQEARELLKDDFDMFEKVEVEKVEQI